MDAWVQEGGPQMDVHESRKPADEWVDRRSETHDANE
jgi:hypothetical protein